MSLTTRSIPLDDEEVDGLPHVAPVPDLAELAKVSADLETRAASAAVLWAWETYKDQAVLAASFQDSVLIDVAMQVAPEIEVVFLDTQYHFAETLWYVDQVRERYDLNLRVLTPQIDPDNLWQVDTDSCCEMRKVEPLARALEGKAAWLTGLRRDEASTRAHAPIVGWDIGRGIVKVNPLAPWTHDDIDSYVSDRHLLQHPLRDKGYPSIGCWPCTQPVAEGDDPPCRPLGGLRQARVRPPRLDPLTAQLSVHEVAVTGFGSEAEAYERGRPSYPPDAVAWLAASLGIAPGRVVADIAAGTGKFTRLIAPYGATLVAVEPVDQMRAQSSALPCPACSPCPELPKRSRLQTERSTRSRLRRRSIGSTPTRRCASSIACCAPVAASA